MNIDKFTIISYDQITGFDRTSGALELILDELSDFTLSQEEEKVDITGKGGRPIGSFKKNKKVTGKGTNGMLSGGALAVLLGANVETSTGEEKYVIRYTDTLKVASASTTDENSGTVTTTLTVATSKPVIDKIISLYIRNGENTYISKNSSLVQTNNASPEKGEFVYDSTNGTIIFHEEDVSDGTEVIAFYDTYAGENTNKITNSADNYSKTLQLFIDVTCQDCCDQLFHGQFIIDRAAFSGTFDIAGASEPATLGFEFTSLPKLCADYSRLFDFIIFNE